MHYGTLYSFWEHYYKPIAYIAYGAEASLRGEISLDVCLFKLFNATVILSAPDIYYRPMSVYVGMVKPTSAIEQGYFDMSSFATSFISIGEVAIIY